MSLSSSHSCTCLDEFAPVLASININRLAPYASRIRQQRQFAKSQECSTASIDCEVLSPPLHGSYHILFQLEFTDGLRWIIKIPVNGFPGRFDEMSARAMKSEALTMQLLKRETTIPVPEVYSFEASTDNELNCPFILMDFIQGISLADSWFKTPSSLISLEDFRANVLKDIAKAMVQLDRFAYEQSGSLVFDDTGNVTGIGPAKVFDGPAYLRYLLAGDDDELFHFFFEMGPLDDPKSFYFTALDRHAKIDPNGNTAKFAIGLEVLLRHFISWVPSEEDAEGSGFVLRHPDLDLQNILVSEEGHLRGIIDWDGVATAPRGIGWEQYPMWLTRDWNPHMYMYSSSRSDDPEHSSDRCTDPDDPELSPKELAYYRSMYAEFMDACLAKEESRSSMEVLQRSANAESCFKSPAHFTRRSLLLQSLALASTDPIFKNEIVVKIFEQIQEITASEYDGSDFDEDLQNESSSEVDCAGIMPSSVASDDSDQEEKEETIRMAHHADGGEIMSHQSFDEEDNNDSSPLLLAKTNTTTPKEECYDPKAKLILSQLEQDGLLGTNDLFPGSGQPSRSEQYGLGLDGTDENFPESHQLEESFQVLHGENKTFHSQYLGSATPQSPDSSYSSMTAGSDNISAADVKPQSDSDSFGLREKLTLAKIHQEKMEGVGDDDDTMTCTDEENKPLFSSNLLEVKNGAGQDNSIGLGEPNHGKMASVDNDTNNSDKMNEEEMNGPCDSPNMTPNLSQEDAEEVVEKGSVDEDTNNSDKMNQEEISGPSDSPNMTPNLSQEDAEEVVEKDNDIRKPSAEYDGVGFTDWEVTHSLADGVLDEGRMRRLKNGFFTLLTSLDSERAVPAVFSGKGTE
ncbi:hypothetical protein MMC07_002459 [Pseudocyphellaria aurata]|nr:hypothetical protein [Pseudocyphellaria aurata]